MNCRRSKRLEALLDRIALEGFEAPEDAIPLVLAEMAEHPRRSKCVEGFLDSLTKRKRQPHNVPYYELQSYVHTLMAYGYREGDDISITATTKGGAYLASILMKLPARFGYSNDWAVFRKDIGWWLRSIRGHYADALIEDLV